MKENKKIFYLVLLIAVTITILGISTYAYFTSRMEVNANVPINLVTAKESVFTASSDSNIQIDITYDQMDQANTSTSYIATDNATVTVRLDSDVADEGVVCTYDLVWVWDSPDAYTEADKTLPIVNGDKTYYYEFSTKIDSTMEADLSTFSWKIVDGKQETTIGTREIFLENAGTKTNTHNISVNVYNIPAHQENILDKSFRAHIEVKNNECKSLDRNLLANVVKLKYTKDGENGLYYHDGQGTYTNADLEAGDNTYRFAGKYSYPKASEGYDTYDSIMKSTSYSGSDGQLFTLAYDETNTMYSVINAESKAIEDGYLKENVNNYICFNGDNCDDKNNLYRIISVDPATNKTKVIKATNLENKSWNEGTYDRTNKVWIPEKGYTATGTKYDIAQGLKIGEVYYNIWAIKKEDGSYYTSTLNQYLNTEYLTEIEKKTDKIENTTWSVGGTSTTNQKTYNYKLEELNNKATYDAKIGLMYASEYGYSALPIHWKTSLYFYEPSRKNNWLSSVDAREWILSRISSSVSITPILYHSGNLYTMDYVYSSVSVHPTFNLSSKAKVISGTGTSSNPYIIE